MKILFLKGAKETDQGATKSHKVNSWPVEECNVKQFRYRKCVFQSVSLKPFNC